MFDWILDSMHFTFLFLYFCIPIHILGLFVFFYTVTSLRSSSTFSGLGLKVCYVGWEQSPLVADFSYLLRRDLAENCTWYSGITDFLVQSVKAVPPAGPGRGAGTAVTHPFWWFSSSLVGHNEHLAENSEGPCERPWRPVSVQPPPWCPVLQYCAWISPDGQLLLFNKWTSLGATRDHLPTLWPGYSLKEAIRDRPCFSQIRFPLPSYLQCLVSSILKTAVL